MKVYIIVKKSRAENRPYLGPTWIIAGLHNLMEENYVSKWYAEYLAEKLTKCNPVGFEVVEIED